MPWSLRCDDQNLQRPIAPRNFDNLIVADGEYAVLVVSQTWTEVQRVNEEVRKRLKLAGTLGLAETRLTALEKLDYTSAQKRDAGCYPPEAVVVFNQKVRGVEVGSRGTFAGVVRCGVLMEVDGRIVTVEKRHLDKITVCRPFEIAVSPGERLLLKANRRMEDGRRVTNGEVVTVERVSPNGAIRLTDGRTLDPTYREFLPAYAVTSYGAQGKTVDYILFSDSTIKAATNSQQWYVTISRGRRGIRIFTSDKPQLQQSIERSGHRSLASDLVSQDRGVTNSVSAVLTDESQTQLSSQTYSRARGVRPTIVAEDLCPVANTP